MNDCNCRHRVVETRRRLAGSVPHRAYLSLVPPGGPAVITAERRIPFEGITNLRDLGGYPTATGGLTQFPRGTFRSSARPSRVGSWMR